MTEAVKPSAVQDDDPKSVTPFPLFDPGDFVSFGTRNLDFATRAARAYLSGASQLGREGLEFVNMRLAKDVAGAQKFVTAKTSHEAYHEQASFLEQALRDYADAASKWMHIAADITNNTLSPVEELTEEILEELDERGAQHEAAA